MDGAMETEPKIDVNEFIKVVQTRRSVRVFENTPIPSHIMNSCLDLALLAPNSSNLQPWEFYWVRSPQKKEEIVKGCLSQPAASTAAELIVCVTRIDTWKKNCKKMIAILEKNPHTPVQVIDFYKRFVPVPDPTSKEQLLTWATKSTCLACENLMLALRAYSYDSCPMEGFDARMVKQTLNLPSDAYITMVIGAGKKAKNGIYGERIRFSREDFIKEV